MRIRPFTGDDIGYRLCYVSGDATLCSRKPGELYTVVV